jgi:hypothetical protein
VHPSLVEGLVRRDSVGVAKQGGGEFCYECAELVDALKGGAGGKVVGDKQLSLKVTMMNVPRFNSVR